MTHSAREIMTKAWIAARDAARHFGGRPAQYLRETLREAWLDAKGPAARAAAMQARVMAEVAKIGEEARTWAAPVRYDSRTRRPFATSARRTA